MRLGMDCVAIAEAFPTRALVNLFSSPTKFH